MRDIAKEKQSVSGDSKESGAVPNSQIQDEPMQLSDDVRRQQLEDRMRGPASGQNSTA